MADCVVCQRQPPERPLVCDSCRRRVDHHLADIADLSALLPGALQPGRGGTQRVSGTREAPLPLRVDVLDLSLPLRGSQTVHDPHGDQTGLVPIAARLDSWVADWLDTVPNIGDQRPGTTVVQLVGWLRVRLDQAADSHPAVDEFAAEMRQTVAALRSVLGHTHLRHRLPAPCPDCDMLTLYRDDGSDWVECGSCRRLWSEFEYARLVVVVTEQVA